jgi:hypothetical protein
MLNAFNVVEALLWDDFERTQVASMYDQIDWPLLTLANLDARVSV